MKYQFGYNFVKELAPIKLKLNKLVNVFEADILFCLSDKKHLAVSYDKEFSGIILNVWMRKKDVEIHCKKSPIDKSLFMSIETDDHYDILHLYVDDMELKEIICK